MEIESQDVIRLIQQFLKENNLLTSLEVLQKESGIGLNAVDNLHSFKADILAGKWDQVLSVLSLSEISPEKLTDLYEQIIIELIELRELGPARSLLRQTETMFLLRKLDESRYLKLENAVSRSNFDPDMFYSRHETKEKRRQKIASDLISELSSVPPSRLLTLLGYSIKWQQSNGIIPVGTKIDLFKGTPITGSKQNSKPVNKKLSTIKFPKGHFAKCVSFSPDGYTVATGSADGFIELWNCSTGKLRKDLPFQASDDLMMMEESVTCLSFSSDGRFICSGSTTGEIRMWRVADGICIKKISNAHTGGVSCICFNNDNSQILSCGLDDTIRLFGLKSGKMQREFRGHTSYVNSVLFTPDNNNVISGSSDGSVRVWEQSSGRCIKVLYTTRSESSLSSPPILSMHPFSFQDNFCVLLCNRTNSIYIYSMKSNNIEKAFTVAEGPKTLHSAVFSFDCTMVYAIGSDNLLYCFDFKSKKVLKTLEMNDLKHSSIVSNQYSNTICTFGQDRYVVLWNS
ncbi:hypothetical protein BB560_000064 [Smittium megazygosporum]|uniref:CTLH domain-containing protein n=1 Tax=Smittium megazygosporum TaxID=133381 RepID=A0A2T9ZLH2_9FUNG|nr:hypothetical protein BB560_000064 [Smittium megazygosporum]